jgi:hypothetical protein
LLNVTFVAVRRRSTFRFSIRPASQASVAEFCHLSSLIHLAPQSPRRLHMFGQQCSDLCHRGNTRQTLAEIRSPCTGPFCGERLELGLARSAGTELLHRTIECHCRLLERGWACRGLPLPGATVPATSSRSRNGEGDAHEADPCKRARASPILERRYTEPWGGALAFCGPLSWRVATCYG